MATLSSQQEAAARSTSGRTLVVAGPGSGKTRTLVARVEHLLKRRANPTRMLVLTFTRLAAEELQRRIDPTLDRRGLFVGTIHAWAAQVLSWAPHAAGLKPGFSVYDTDDYERLVRMAGADASAGTGKRVTTLLKNPRVAALVKERMRAANAVTYDDLLERAPAVLDMGDPIVFDHVLVDEAQDLSQQQWDLIRHVEVRSLWVVADVRQSIYRWRDARPDLLRQIPWDAIHQLTLNYRSAHLIVDLVNDVMPQPGPERLHPMTVVRTTPRPDALTYDAAPDELEVIRQHVLNAVAVDGWEFGDVAILGRTWRMLHAIAEELRDNHVPCQVFDGQEDPEHGVEHYHAHAAYLRLLANRADDELVYQTLALWGNLPEGLDFLELRAEASRSRRSAFKVAKEQGWLRPLLIPNDITSSEAIMGLVTRLGTRHRSEATFRYPNDRYLAWLDDPQRSTPERFAWWWTHGRTAQDRLATADRERVQLMSVHAAKGLEWPVVIVPGCNEGIYPLVRERVGTDAYEESRCLFFVACSRARDRLHLTRRSVFDRDGEPVQATPSPFLPDDFRRGS